MTDPIRLADSPDLPPEVRRALRAERGQSPPRALRASVWAGLAASLGLGSTVSTAAAGGAGALAAAGGKSAMTALVSVSALKWMAVGAGVGGSLALGVEVVTYAGERETSRTGDVLVVDAPRHQVGSAPAPVPPPPPASPPSDAVEPASQPSRDAIEPESSDDGPATPASRLPAPARPAAGASEPPSSTRPSAEVAAPDSPTSTAREEATRVAQARDLLRRGNGAAALTTLVLLDRELRGGLLIQERQALRVEALVALGRMGEAREAADAFLRRYPESPHAGRVRSWRAQAE